MWARSLIAGVLSAAVMVLGASGVSGQDYPNKTIRIYSNQPGGVFDFLARIIAQGLTGPLGQPVLSIIDRATLFQRKSWPRRRRMVTLCFPMASPSRPGRWCKKCLTIR